MCQHGRPRHPLKNLLARQPSHEGDARSKPPLPCPCLTGTAGLVTIAYEVELAVDAPLPKGMTRHKQALHILKWAEAVAYRDDDWAPRSRRHLCVFSLPDDFASRMPLGTTSIAPLEKRRTLFAM